MIDSMTAQAVSFDRDHTSCYALSVAATFDLAPEAYVIATDVAENAAVARSIGMQAYLIDRAVAVFPTLLPSPFSGDYQSLPPGPAQYDTLS